MEAEWAAHRPSEGGTGRHPGQRNTLRTENEGLKTQVAELSPAADNYSKIETFLEQNGILDAGQRELVLDRAMALDQEELDLDDLKWVVLMVLFNQPGSEAAYAWMETQMFLDEPEPVH